MRILFILIVLIITSCQRDLSKDKIWIGEAGIPQKTLIHCEDKAYKTSAVYCLRDWLIGEDAGGTWQQIGILPQNINSMLVGDNPCIEWSPLACGQYNLMYIVGDLCCKDTAYVNPLKCCLVGSSNCN